MAGVDEESSGAFLFGGWEFRKCQSDRKTGHSTKNRALLKGTNLDRRFKRMINQTSCPCLKKGHPNFFPKWLLYYENAMVL